MCLVFNIQANTPEEMKEKVKALAVLLGIDLNQNPNPANTTITVNPNVSSSTTTSAPIAEPTKRRGRPPKGQVQAQVAITTTDIPSIDSAAVPPTNTTQSLENVDADIFGEPVATATATATADASVEKAPTRDEVLNILTEFKTKLSVDALRTMLLNEFGASRMSDVKEADYGKLVASCKRALASKSA